MASSPQAVSSSTLVSDGLLCYQLGMDIERLRYAFHCYLITEPLQGWYGRACSHVPPVWDAGPRSAAPHNKSLPEQMIHDHTSYAPRPLQHACRPGVLEAPEGAPQKCRSLASRPCTLDEDASQWRFPLPVRP